MNGDYGNGSRLFPPDTARYCIYLAGLFALSRLVYFAAGVRFVDDLDNLEKIAPVARVFDVILYGQLSSLWRDNYHSDFKSRNKLPRGRAARYLKNPPIPFSKGEVTSPVRYAHTPFSKGEFYLSSFSTAIFSTLYNRG